MRHVHASVRALRRLVVRTVSTRDYEGVAALVDEVQVGDAVVVHRS